MASINMSSIMHKVNAYASSKEGKKRTSDIINRYRKEGKTKTEGGSEILTKVRMAELASELINILKQTASSYDLPNSVMKHFETLDYIVQDIGEDKFECYIYFNDDLSRESLETDYNQGDGIDNIIALFNNGYVASAPKYGWWNGYSPTGESLSRANTGTELYTYIKSKQARPSLRFMQTSIEDFYSKYGKQYAMTVTLNDDYDGNYNGSLNGIISKI